MEWNWWGHGAGTGSSDDGSARQREAARRMRMGTAVMGLCGEAIVVGSWIFAVRA